MVEDIVQVVGGWSTSTKGCGGTRLCFQHVGSGSGGSEVQDHLVYITHSRPAGHVCDPAMPAGIEMLDKSFTLSESTARWSHDLPVSSYQQTL